MAAGVVDDLELVDIEVQDRVVVIRVLRPLERGAQAVLELAPDGQTGQRVVRRQVRQARRVFLLAGAIDARRLVGQPPFGKADGR